MTPQDTMTYLGWIATGPLPDEDRLLEIALVRVEDGEETQTSVFLANPGEIPLAVRHRTGLDERQVAGRPGPERMLQDALAGLDGACVVASDAALFLRFAEAVRAAVPRTVLDLSEYARVLAPDCADWSLETVAARMELPVPKMLRGLDLARLTHRIWSALRTRSRSVPSRVLAVLEQMSAGAGSLSHEAFWRPHALHADGALSDGPAGEWEMVFRPHTRVFQSLQSLNRPQPREEPIDTGKLCAMFRERGVVGRRLDHFEPRVEQVEMVEAVSEALNSGRHLMCEAGTGTGKSMAYLLPAIAWACQNGDRVIVSTNTKNLQDQLCERDLPFLQQLLGERFRMALLKGRGNYLCVRKFLSLIRHHERELTDPREMAAMMPLMVWALSTESGDLSQCHGFASHPGAVLLQAQVTATGDECAGQACRSQGRCFVRRARALAQLADLVVVNHALLLADVLLDRPYLPHEQCVVFDEAHNIEDAATEAASVEIDGLRFYRVCRRLWRSHADGSGAGLIAVLSGMIRRSFPGDGPLSRDAALAMTGRVIEAVGTLTDAVRVFFDTLARPFETASPGENRILLDRCHPPVSEHGETGRAAGVVTEACRLLQRHLSTLAECVEANAGSCEEAPETASDLTARIQQLQEAMDDLEFILSRSGEQYVYWLQRTVSGPREYYALKAAPLDVGGFLRTYFFDERRSVIMVSATLRVNGRFDYFRERLGLGPLGDERVMCRALGSPFDFRNQVRVCVPTFLPEAGGRRDMAYDMELSSFLIDLLRATSGRALVLFTSYSLLNTVHEHIKRPLERMGLPLLAQGRDGSRRMLIRLFRENVGSVLLGTQSFWEGVDVLGESLSCLVVTKLPFHVFTDPLVQGRIQHLRDHGTDPFRHYTLPQAIINFRQGFGRLIRHRSDRGVVVVTDRRMATRSYGRRFLDDISAPSAVYDAPEPLLDAVSRFLVAGS